MLMYALSEHKETGMTIYQVVETLLSQIKAKTSGNNQLFNNVIEIHEVNIESFWVKDYQAQSFRFLDCLNKYLSFVEANISSYAEFFSQLTFQLDDRIAIDIRKDIEKIKGDENRIKSYRSDLQKIVDRLKKINSDLPYIKRFNNELTFISKQLQSIAQKIKIEKIDKTKVTHEKFNEIVAQHQESYKSNTQKDFNKKFWWSIGIAAISLVLLIASVANGASALGFITLILVILFAGLGALLGASAENGWAILIGLIAGGWLGSYLGKMIPIEAIYILSGGSLAIFGGRAYLLNKNREDAINAVDLDSNEQNALKQSLEEVGRFFTEKESYEAFQETVRILSLDEQQFEKEFSGANLNPVS